MKLEDKINKGFSKIKNRVLPYITAALISATPMLAQTLENRVEENYKKTTLTQDSNSFSPVPLEVSSYTLTHDFDGSCAVFPVEISGTPANVIFSIFAENYGGGETQNGYLGWHYVNQIDTCIYVSPPHQCVPGRNYITWDGKDSTGNFVPPDSYTYYLWAYDNVNEKKLVTKDIDSDKGVFRTRDENNNVLPNPEFYTNPNVYHTEENPISITRQKKIIGSDVIESTTYKGWIDRGNIAFDPKNNDFFFVSMYKPNQTLAIRKYQWIPNGEAILQEDWGVNGEVSFPTSIPSENSLDPGVVNIGDDFLIAVNKQEGDNPKPELVMYDINNGDEIKRIDLSDWWIDYFDEEMGGQLIGGPTNMTSKGDFLALNSKASCLNQLINPTLDDFVMWVNQNGDYVGDKNTVPDAVRPWICNDCSQPPYPSSIALDKNMFAVFPASGLGNASFGLFAPDGTGINHFSFADEVGEDIDSINIIDEGTAYDGMYINKSNGEDKGLWYVANDSFKGHLFTSFPRDPMWHLIPKYYKPFDCRHHNGKRATIVINKIPTIYGRKLGRKEEVGIFSPQGLCVGSHMIWDNEKEPLYLTVLGDDPTTQEVDGMLEGEKFVFRFSADDKTMATPIYTSEKTTYSDYGIITIDQLFVGTPTSVEEIPSKFSLSQNYPNPFNSSTLIQYQLPEKSNVNLDVYNVTGQKVKTLVDNVQEQGKYEINFNASDLPSGLYFYRLTTPESVKTERMMLVK